MRPILHLLTGCTAVGKTEWALRWAESRGAEILSCDSLLFYRGMDIGTAKPTTAERARVPHHLVDIARVADRMDIARYVRLARAGVDEIVARGRPILVVGGSGFYLKAFFAPVVDEVEVAPGLRAAVSQFDLPSAIRELEKLNPAGLGALDTANPRRVQRALERCLASGKTLAVLAAEFQARPAPFHDCDVRLTRLDRPRSELDERGVQRVEEMLARGLVAEVEGLLAEGLRDNPSAVQAIGYREVVAVLDGLAPRGALAATIAANTRALVKKQRTWLRTQLPPHRVIPAAEVTLDELFG